MNSTPRSLCVLAVALLLLATGCSSHSPSASPSRLAASPPSKTGATGTSSSLSDTPPITGSDKPDGVCADPEKIQASERNRDSCYHLQPARTVVHKKAAPKTKKTAAKTTAKTANRGTKGKSSSKTVTATSVKTAKSTTAKATTKTTGKNKGKHTANPTITSQAQEYRTVGLCQPQSLIYARCRTGITTCQLGNTSPVQWFACARTSGATTATPTAGSVIVLDANRDRNMATGHPAYVEEVHNNPDGTWTLRLSHTNYDRQCHLDQDATVLFDPRRMTASFESGPWGPWAKNLKVMGFILR
jgi:hypothetical protein